VDTSTAPVPSASGPAGGASPHGLAELAAAYGVATSYQDSAGRQRLVAERTVVAVLGLLGVDASGPEAVRAALAESGSARRGRLLPPTVVVRHGPGATVTIGSAGTVRARVVLEDGGERELAGSGPRLDLGDVPLGWHRLDVEVGPGTEVEGGVEVEADGEAGPGAEVSTRRASAVLVVAPTRVALPPGLGRAWGWAVQLYSVRSAGSWGIGDYADLAELARWSGAEQGAGLLLSNPLHAVTPVLPVQPSPYYPSSRRFRSPLHLRLEATSEHAAAGERLRAEVAALRPDAPADRVDRDLVWTAKRAGLELLWPGARGGVRAEALATYRAEQGQGLEDFALFCALAETYGVPWQTWPVELHDPASPAVAREREALADRVAFHAWLQLLCDEQLAAAGRAAREAGMGVGVVHDLAVGVDPGGADAWGLQGVLGLGATVGAPPDPFNQLGQDWQQPPWRPDRLAEVGYAPFRDMVRAVLRSAGGVRVDHVLGLFRLWWIPEGNAATDGTYVAYDAEALLGVLALEAHRAGALVVGEDLGTVEPRVRRELAERGVLGSAVLYFERGTGPDGEDTGPLPPARWREEVMASVTTHDLPTAAGFLSDEAVRVRARLGLLEGTVEEEERRVAREREELLEMLRAEGLLPDGATPEETVLALHAALVAAPARLVVAALGDAVGDVRQPNLPGTVDEYPNWRLPVAAPGPDGAPRPVLLEELRASPAVRRLADLLRAGTAGRA